MDSNRVDLFWRLSLAVIVVGTLVLVGTKMVNIELADIVVRIVGITELIAFLVFSFTTVQRSKRR